jgi:hypothetical protein
MNTTPNETLEHWVEHSKPAEWEDWEWHCFLCAIARNVFEEAKKQTGLTTEQLIKFFSMPPTEFHS